MKHKIVRTLLYIPLLLVAAFDIAYAVVALTGLLDRSLVVWLPRTSFSDSTIPMLLLAVVVGGSSLWMTEYRGHSFLIRHINHA